MDTLIIDADDTLWENNIYYEECEADFARLMEQQGLKAQEARQTLQRVEAERVPVVGYAPREFARSLVIAYRRLCQRNGQPESADVADAVRRIGVRVTSYPIVLLEGVEETLDRLSGRVRLLLLTKGDRTVQKDKLRRSGLGRFFETVEIVQEKDVSVFHDLIDRYDLHPDRTWMVGNSPRSDVNPAVEAGLQAVYVPHPNTWGLEIEEVVDSERVTVLRRFGELDAFLTNRGGHGR